eukprot:3150195-Ditylum_brightwellii.AAC.1
MDRYEQIKPADLVANGVSYNKLMDISQPIDGYICVVFMKFQHAMPKYQQDAPHKYILSQYGQTV